MKNYSAQAAGLMLAASVALFSGQAMAKGCLKGALVGGVAGAAVKHGKMGAAAGCAVGHHRAAKKAKAASGAQ